MSETCVLTTCRHGQCKECLIMRTKKVEAAGHGTCAACPFCRVDMTEEDALAILGRPFQPAAASHQQSTAQMDDLTGQWIKSHAWACPSCGTHTQKEERARQDGMPLWLPTLPQLWLPRRATRLQPSGPCLSPPGATCCAEDGWSKRRCRRRPGDRRAGVP